MAWIWNHKHEIEEKSTKSSWSSSKVVGLGLADLWEFPTLVLRIPAAASWLPILLSNIGSQVKRRQSQIYKLKEFAEIYKFWNKLYTRHTFWSCLIRCANMKWIQRVLLKIQCVHRRTDGQGETSIPPFQLHWSWGYKNICILEVRYQ